MKDGTFRTSTASAEEWEQGRAEPRAARLSGTNAASLVKSAGFSRLFAKPKMAPAPPVACSGVTFSSFVSLPTNSGSQHSLREPVPVYSQPQRVRTGAQSPATGSRQHLDVVATFPEYDDDKMGPLRCSSLRNSIGVLETELPNSSPLLGRDNIIFTRATRASIPKSRFWSCKSREPKRVRVLHGEAPLNPVNPGCCNPRARLRRRFGKNFRSTGGFYAPGTMEDQELVCQPLEFF